MQYQEAEKLTNDVARRLRYIAELNPRGVNKLAYKYGYPVPRENVQSKFNFLTVWFAEEGSNDKALDELMMTHPDFNLFAETMASKLGVMPTERGISKYNGPLQYEPDDGDELDEDEFGNYDGFIDSHDTYHNDNFIDAIAGAVKGVAGAAGKFAGTGKKGREAQQKLAEEQTKQAQVSVQLAAIEAKKAEKEQRAKTKRIIIWSLIIVSLVVVVTVVYFGFIRKK